jgi:CheY-specific phosphatase CheX
VEAIAQVQPLFPETGKADAAKGIASLQNLLHQNALKSFCQHFRFDTGQSTVLQDGGPVYDHWMSLILMAGPGIKVTVKSFFNHRSVAEVVANFRNKPASEIPIQLTCDFMKEFCNLLGGNVKRVLLDNSISVGLSLPLLTRGFDEAMSNRKKDFSVIQQVTRFSSANFAIVLQTEVSITDPVIFQQLANAVLTQTSVPEDDMEFL